MACDGGCVERLEFRGREERREAFGDFPGGVDRVLGSERLLRKVLADMLLWLLSF